MVGRGRSSAFLGANFDLPAPGGALSGGGALRRLGYDHLPRGVDQPARPWHRQHLNQPHLARLCAGRPGLRRALFHQRSGPHRCSIWHRRNDICSRFPSHQLDRPVQCQRQCARERSESNGSRGCNPDAAWAALQSRRQASGRISGTCIATTWQCARVRWPVS